MHPTAAYRQLRARRADDGSTGRWLTRLTFFACMLGGFVSFTTTGRLSARLVLVEAVFWSVVPLLQTAAAAAVSRIFAQRRRRTVELDLFLAGNGPWHLWLLAISGVCLFASTEITDWLPGRVWLAATFVAAVAWSTWVRYAFFSRVLDLSARRATAALATYNALLWGAFIGYGALSGQLIPRLARTLGI